MIGKRDILAFLSVFPWLLRLGPSDGTEGPNDEKQNQEINSRDNYDSSAGTVRFPCHDSSSGIG